MVDPAHRRRRGASRCAELLPRRWRAVLGDYERHLVSERDLTAAHGAGLPRRRRRRCSTTPRGWATEDVSTLDLRTLRSWLAKQQTRGQCPHHDGAAGHRRPGVHGLGARARGYVAARPGRAARLPEGAPDAAAGAAGRRGREPARARRRRTPTTAAPSGCATSRCSSCSTRPASGSVSCAASTSTTSTASAASCGSSARAARSAPCPFGAPAERALDALARARPRRAAPSTASGPALFLGARGGRIDQRAVRTARAPPPRRRPRRPGPRPARAAAHRRDPPARGRRRPAHGAGAARARLARHDADLHPRHHRPAARRPTARPTPGPDADPAAPAGDGAAGAGRSSVRPASGASARAAANGRLRRAADGRSGASQRQQPHRAGADQAQRVAVGPSPDEQPPVQAGRAGGSATPNSSEAPERSPAATRSPASHGGRHRLVGRAAAAVVDDHDAAAGDGPGEADRARAARPGPAGRAPGEVDAAVPGAPGRRRRVEAATTSGRRVQRPHAVRRVRDRRRPRRGPAPQHARAASRASRRGWRGSSIAAEPAQSAPRTASRRRARMAPARRGAPGDGSAAPGRTRGDWTRGGSRRSAADSHRADLRLDSRAATRCAG